MKKGELKPNGVHLEEQAIRELEHHFKLSKRIRRMKVVTKDRKILDFEK